MSNAPDRRPLPCSADARHPIADTIDTRRLLAGVFYDVTWAARPGSRLNAVSFVLRHTQSLLGWSVTSPNGAAKDSPGQRPGKHGQMDDGALKGRPNHGRFGRPFRALTTNGGQPRALPWAIFGRPAGALAMNLLWVVEHMRGLKKRRWFETQPGRAAQATVDAPLIRISQRHPCVYRRSITCINIIDQNYIDKKFAPILDS